MKKLFGAILALLLAGPVFGQALSNLPNGTTPTGTEYVPIVQGGNTVKVTTAQILAYIDTQTITWTNPQTYSQLMTLNNGLTVATGNIGITSGNLTVGGTSTFTGLATASNGLNVTAGGETISAPVSGANITLNSKGDTYADSGFTVTTLPTHAAIGTFTDGQTGTKEWAIGAGLGAVGGFGIYDVTDGTQALTANSNGSVNFPVGVLVGAQPSAFGEAGGTSACTLGGFDNVGLSSCTWNSAGTYTVTFSVASPHSYLCAVSLVAQVGYAVMNSSTTTTAVIKTFNASGTLTDSLFALNCH